MPPDDRPAGPERWNEALRRGGLPGVCRLLLRLAAARALASGAAARAASALPAAGIAPAVSARARAPGFARAPAGFLPAAAEAAAQRRLGAVRP